MGLHNCILCGSNKLGALGQVHNRRFHQIEVHRSIPAKSTIYHCESCGHTQKFHDGDELAALQTLYDNYTVGNFSLQVTQSVFLRSENDRTVKAKTREDHVLDMCSAAFEGAKNILDVGCGTGSFLRNVGQRYPAARLHAYEVTESLKDQLLSIKNVVSFHSGPLSELPSNSYDCITLWQCLEHLDAPGKYLEWIHNLLTDDGHLLVQVPDLARMPFDLAVFEHWSHFHNAGLIAFLQSCGYELLIDGRDWVHNCSTILLKKGPKQKLEAAQSCDVAVRQLDWLNHSAAFFSRELRNIPGNFLILGVGTAAGWLYGLLDRRPLGFLEEDRTRIGLLFDQIPVLAPQDAPAGISVLIPFVASQGMQIKNRLQELYPNLKDSVMLTTRERY